MSNPSNPLTEYQKAAAIARYVEINDVQLNSLSASMFVSREEFFRTEVGQIQQEKTVRTSFHEATSSIHVEIFFVALLAGRSSEPGSEMKDLVRIECTFLLSYLFQVQGGPPENERDSYFKAFGDLNGVYNAWPYLRELVQATSTRMGLPPVTLPVHRANTPKAESAK